MGTYLSTPVLDKCWEEQEDFDNTTPVAWGVVDMQGWRKTMEDAHIAQTDVPPPSPRTGHGHNTKGSGKNTKDHAQVFAVFDGHGGAEVARFCQLYMVDVLTRQHEWVGDNGTEVDVGKALVNCFHCMDDLLRDPSRSNEIQELKVNKPNFGERRTLIDSSKELLADGGEEKKMEDTRHPNGDEKVQVSTKPSDDNTSPSSSDGAPEINEVSSTADDDGDNDIVEIEETVDIASTDAVSLFSRLLTITNKTGATSGTVPLNLNKDAKSNNKVGNANQVITPTVFHNGRPVCNLPDHPIHAGCTAVCAVINGKTLTVANAGDSRVVLCRAGGVTLPMSFDHKPMQDTEMRRITQAGGFVNQFGRVNGNLNLSRSIGDLKYKQVPNITPAQQMITAEPDIKQVELRDNDEFIILACDGIWDCLTNEEAVKFVRDRIDQNTPTEIGVEMLDAIVSKDPRETQGIGGDNMTVMIVDLLPHKRSYRHGSSTQGNHKNHE